MTAFLVAFLSLLIAILAITILGGTVVHLEASVRSRTLEGWRQHRPRTAIASQSPWTPDNSLFAPSRFPVSHDRELFADLEFPRI